MKRIGVIGKLLIAKKLPKARLVVLSSRISYELVQKAARARIPIILAMSRPRHWLWIWLPG